MTLTKKPAAPWTVIGVDNGMRLCAVTSPGGLLTGAASVHPFHLTEHAPGKRCHQAMQWMWEIVSAARDPERPVHVFVESPFISPRSMSAAIPLARLQGALMAGAQAGGAAAVYEVAASQWKLGVFGQGNGNADKEFIAAEMHTRWPWLFEYTLVTMPKTMRQDALDAGGITLYGVDVLSRAAHLTEHREE